MPQMSGYTKLFSSILASTIWREPMEVRIVWITLLAMAGRNGIAEGSVPGVADFARLPVEPTRKALAKLSAPDEDSRSKEHEGRRIKAVDGGWLILNHAKYRAKLGADERRDYLKIKAREYRRRRAVDKRKQISTSSTQAEAEATTEAEKIKPVRRAPRSEPGEPQSFSDFWSLYPNRKGKQAALKAWRKLNPDADLIGILASALVWQKGQPQWTKDGGQFVPMLATWLNNRRWEDEPFEPARPRVTGPDYAATFDWSEECARLHNGRCGNATFHDAVMQESET